MIPSLTLSLLRLGTIFFNFDSKDNQSNHAKVQMGIQNIMQGIQGQKVRVLQIHILRQLADSYYTKMEEIKYYQKYYQRHLNQVCMDFDFSRFEKCKLLTDQTKWKIVFGCQILTLTIHVTLHQKTWIQSTHI